MLCCWELSSIAELVTADVPAIVDVVAFESESHVRPAVESAADAVPADDFVVGLTDTEDLPEACISERVVYQSTACEFCGHGTKIACISDAQQGCYLALLLWITSGGYAWKRGSVEGRNN